MGKPSDKVSYKNIELCGASDCNIKLLELHNLATKNNIY